MTFIEDMPALTDAMSKIGAHSTVAIDTEFSEFKTELTIFMVQIGTVDGHSFVFNCRALPHLLTPSSCLGLLLQDEQVVKVFHAAQSDNEKFRKYGMKVVNAVDTNKEVTRIITRDIPRLKLSTLASGNIEFNFDDLALFIGYPANTMTGTFKSSFYAHLGWQAKGKGRYSYSFWQKMFVSGLPDSLKSYAAQDVFLLVRMWQDLTRY